MRVFLAALLAVGCGGRSIEAPDGGGGESDADSGGDGDSDGDSDADADGDADGFCPMAPEPCPARPYCCALFPDGFFECVDDPLEPPWECLEMPPEGSTQPSTCLHGGEFRSEECPDDFPHCCTHTGEGVCADHFPYGWQCDGCVGTCNPR